MSKISANILRDKDGAVETPMKYPVRGSAKAWAIHDNAAAVLNSLNVASAVDVGTGDWYINLTAQMASVNYAADINGGYNFASSQVSVWAQHNTGAAVGTFRYSHFLGNGTAIDPLGRGGQPKIWGELA